MFAGEGDVITEANDAFLELIGATREELEDGQLEWPALTPPEYAARDAHAVAEMLERGWSTPYEKEFVGRDGARVPIVIGPATLSASPFRWICFVLDARGRRDAEAHLQARVEQAAALAALGEAALAEPDLDLLLERACAVLGEHLHADFANVLQIDAAESRLVLRTGWRWPAELVGRGSVPLRPDVLAGYVVQTRQPVVVDDVGRERRFTAPELMLGVGIRSSVTVLVGPEEEPFGVLSAHGTRPRSFSEDDVSFAQGVANVVAAAVRRARGDDVLQERERSLRLVLSGTRTAAWWWDVQGDEVRWSENLPGLHGLAVDETPASYADVLRNIHADDRATLDAAVQRALDEGVGYDVQFRTVWPDGSVHWLHTEASVETGPDGRVTRLMGVVRDVTRVRRRQEQERLLARATELLARPREPRRAFRELAQLCVPDVADWCVVHLVGRDGQLPAVAVAHRDPDRMRWAMRLARRYPVDPDDDGGVALVARTGVLQRVQPITAEMLDAAARDAGHREALEVVGLHAALLVPLLSREGVLGVLVLAFAESGQRFDDDDERFALELGRRASTALETARLHQAEREARRRAEDAASRTARLQGLAAALALATTREDVAEAFVEAASAATGATAAFMSSGDGERFEVTATRGYPEEFIRSVGRFTAGDESGFGALAAVRREPVWVESNDEVAVRYPALAEARREIGLEAAVLLPLVAQGRVVGVGSVAFSEPRRFSRSERELLLTMARQSAQALERARLLAETQEARATAESRRAALERLLTLSPTFHGATSLAATAEAVCATAVELLEGDTASLHHVDEQSVRRLAAVPADTAEHASWPAAVRGLVADGRPTFAPATPTEPATLRLPLVRQGSATACLTVTWSHRERSPDAAELAFATRVADQAAIALERAERLEAQQRAELLAAALERLLDPPPGIEEQATVAATAREIVTVACDTFGCDAAGLWERTTNGFKLLARVPATAGLTLGQEVPLGALPGGGSWMLAQRPWFQADMRTTFEDHDLVEASGMVSALLVPLVRGAETMLDLTLSWAEEIPEPGPETFALAQRLADRAYAALERARRTEALQEAGKLHARLEASLMPVVSAATPAADVVLRYRAGEQRLAIGGDFADALALADGRIATIIGDVSGHGPDAAAMGATLRAGWRTLVLQGFALDRLPQALQELLQAERPSRETFVTVCCAELSADGRQLDLCSAGHPTPLLLDADGVQELAPVGFAPPLGIVPVAEGARRRARLAPGACVLLYSDGLIEGRSSPGVRDRLGISGLKAYLAGLATIAPFAPGHVLDAAMQHATAANGEELPDDVALLMLTPRTPPVVQLRLPARPEMLAVTREIIDRVTVAAGLPRALGDDARLAVTEAAANVVMHAYPERDGVDAVLLLEVRADDEGLIVVVADEGVGIGGREGTSGAGLGLPLVRHLASHVQVDSGPQGTRVELRFTR